MNLRTLSEKQTQMIATVSHPIVQPKAPGVSKHGWVHMTSHLDPSYGGISAAVPLLCKALAQRSGSPVHVRGFCLDNEQIPAFGPDLQIRTVPPDRKRWFLERSLHAKLSDEIRTADGVHIHGIWECHSAVAAGLARRTDKPYIIAAHGMLDLWAVRQKALKKHLYKLLVEGRNLRGAACLHALTETERQDYRREGYQGPVAVVPNGVTVPPACDGSEFFRKFPNLQGMRLVLFLGRIHKKKGLDILVKAWAQIIRRWSDAHLVIAGPDFEDTLSEIEAQVDSLRLRDRVTFTGMLAGSLKWHALAAADVFVLPSHSEGLSVSVLEAMGTGLPVIVTEQCNIPEVGRSGCGWLIQPEPEQLESALDQFLRTSTHSVQVISANARRLVSERFSWSSVAGQMTGVYEWIANGGPRPRCVEE